MELVHQNLHLTIDVPSERIHGFTELQYKLIDGRPPAKIFLNCRQTRVSHVKVNGVECSARRSDPLKSIVLSSRTAPLSIARIRRESIKALENPGELEIDIPELLPYNENKLTVLVEYYLEAPTVGLRFVHHGPPAGAGVSVFTEHTAGEVSTWLPCVDALDAKSSWRLSYTVDRSLTVVSAGKLMEITAPDESSPTKTYVFELSVPSPASHIGFVAGVFDVMPDTELSSVCYFAHPGLLSSLAFSTSVFSKAVKFFEVECVDKGLPLGAHSVVFVQGLRDPLVSLAGLSLLSAELLHTRANIEQAFSTQLVLAEAIATQYFGHHVTPEEDEDQWVVLGLVGYLVALFVRKFHGTNEYHYWLDQEMMRVVEEGHQLPPLSSSHFFHPSDRFSEAYKRKAGVIMRMFELQIRKDAMLELLGRILERCHHHNTLSTSKFFTMAKEIANQDFDNFKRSWVDTVGHAALVCKHEFNRKKGVIEIEITQEESSTRVGLIMVGVQETEAYHEYPVLVERSVVKMELPCLSRNKKTKRKVTRLETGEEITVNLTAIDTDSPLLWVCFDPGHLWLRTVTLTQPDFMHVYQLRYDRNTAAQVKAASYLGQMANAHVLRGLVQSIRDPKAFYRVRAAAAVALAKCAEMDETCGPTLIELFNEFFGLAEEPSVVRPNRFDDFVAYFLQKALVESIGAVRTREGYCPPVCISFLLKTLAYNICDEVCNDDSVYVSHVVRALGNAFSWNLDSLELGTPLHLQYVGLLEAAMPVFGRYLVLDHVIPSFHYSFTSTSLAVLESLARTGVIEVDHACTTLWPFTREMHFESVRMQAFRSLVALAGHSQDGALASRLLALVLHEPHPRIRFGLLECLAPQCMLLPLSSNAPIFAAIFRESPCRDIRLRSVILRMMVALLPVAPARAPIKMFIPRFVEGERMGTKRARSPENNVPLAKHTKDDVIDGDLPPTPEPSSSTSVPLVHKEKKKKDKEKKEKKDKERKHRHVHEHSASLLPVPIDGMLPLPPLGDLDPLFAPVYDPDGEQMINRLPPVEDLDIPDLGLFSEKDLLTGLPPDSTM